MPSYRELLQQVKGEIEEIDAARTAELRETDSPVLVDVRERLEDVPGDVVVRRDVDEVRVDRRDIGGHPDAEIRRARGPEREQGGAEGEAEMIEAHRRGMGGSRNAPADCNRRSRAG